MLQADLFEAIEQQEDSKLQNVIIYGKITRVLEETGHIANLIHVGEFVEVEVYGVQCQRTNYFESQKAGQIAVTPGTLIALCDDLRYVGKDVRIYKRPNVGADIRTKSKNYPSPNEVTVLTWVFDRNLETKFRIEPNHFELMGSESRDASAEPVIMTEYAGITEPAYPRFSGMDASKIKEKFIDPSLLGGDFDEKPTESGKVEETEDLKKNSREAVKQSAIADLDEGPTTGLVNRSEVEDKYESLDVLKQEIMRTYYAREAFLDDQPEDFTYDESKYPLAGILLGFWRVYGEGIHGRDAAGEKCKIVLESVYKRMGLKNVEVDEALTRVTADGSLIFSGTGIGSEADNRKLFFFSVLDELLATNMTAKLINADQILMAAQMACTNPYLFAMHHGFSLLTADKLFFLMAAFRKFEDFDLPRMTELRDVLICVELMTDSSITPSTIVPTSRLFDSGIPLSKTLQFGIQNFGLPYTSKKKDVLDEVLAETRKHIDKIGNLTIDGQEIGIDSDAVEKIYRGWSVGVNNYHKMGWYRGGDKFTPINGASFVKKLDEWGIGVHLEDTREIIASNYFQMEEYVYSATQLLGSIPSGVGEEHISEAIRQYEDAKGFKLEELQKEAIYNILPWKCGVLAGQAGSGKTTVAECIVMALKLAKPDYKIKFAAPTGKAANRMKEVLGDLGEVRTLHSLFRLGIGAPNLFQMGEREYGAGTDEKVIYIMDEMAMVTTDVLYQVTKRLGREDMVYFLGDIKQLPPIGKGLPFRDMLNYLPATELGVSKRAKDGSGINYNCDIINQKSYAKDFELLKQFDDFLLVTENDENVVKTLIQGVRNEMKNYAPDDIQVATPYATPVKQHSSTSLNPQLQELFLPDADVAFTYRNNKFKLGARVIHTKANWRHKMRYVMDTPGVLRQVRSTGVVNGEVGKIVGVLLAKDVIFQYDDEFNRQYEENGAEIEFDDPEPGQEKRTAYVLLETQDADLGIPVIVAYRSTLMGGGISGNENEGALLNHGQIDKLELAYALTVHKLQGSQAKLVVIPFMGNDNARFITRNMLYTAVSRAQEKVVLIGSVDGRNSMVSQSRRSTTVNTVRSMLSVMAGVQDL